MRGALEAPGELHILPSELRTAMRTNEEAAQQACPPGEALLEYLGGILGQEPREKG